MRLLLDMNVSPLLTATLSKSGHESVHWSEVGDPRAKDEAIMRYARESSSILITHDLDFGAILSATRAEGPSVVQMRMQDILSTKYLSTLLMSLDRFSEDLKIGALLVINENKTRVRILPLRTEDSDD
jgi:predicted nuclease of predicted toxin-antitoxin system